MKPVQYIVSGLVLAFVAAQPIMACQSNDVQAAGSVVCKNVQSRTETATVPAGVLSRKGDPRKSAHHLASRFKPVSRMIGDRGLTPGLMPQGHTLRVQATAYALYGRTATGTVTTHGSIAVDPRVIPYGSRIYVPGYGWGTAVDCGGAIVGNIIDLWMPSNAECFQWGRRTVDVIVQAPHK